MKFAPPLVIVASLCVRSPIAMAQAPVGPVGPPRGAPAPVGPTAPVVKQPSAEAQPAESLEAVMTDIEHSVGDLSGLDKAWEALSPLERTRLTTELEQIRKRLDDTAQQPAGPLPSATKPPFKAVIADLERSTGELRSLDKSWEELNPLERSRLTTRLERIRKQLDETIEKPVGPVPPPGTPTMPPGPPPAPKPKPTKPSSEGVSQ